MVPELRDLLHDAGDSPEGDSVDTDVLLSSARRRVTRRRRTAIAGAGLGVAAAVLAALARLAPRQRACVVLRYYEDLSVAQTAEALGCSEGNVKSQTSRALATLQSTIRLQSGEDVVVTQQGVG